MESLDPRAVGISASRRTDIPALFAPWFRGRLEAGFVEYVPAGPPRRVRRSLAPRDVTHFTFWTKWPRPFLSTLRVVLERGFPVLWNVTITGLGGTDLEPHVPSAERAVPALLEVSRRVGAAAVMWRYDPVLVTDRFDARHHLATFTRLADALAGHVDRVALSYVELFARRVAPNLAAWERESGDRLHRLSLDALEDLFGRLREVAESRGIPFTLCCSEPLRARLGVPRSGCNRFDWAVRVYPELARHRPLRDRSTRDGCACSEAASGAWIRSPCLPPAFGVHAPRRSARHACLPATRDPAPRRRRAHGVRSAAGGKKRGETHAHPSERPVLCRSPVLVRAGVGGTEPSLHRSADDSFSMNSSQRVSRAQAVFR